MKHRNILITIYLVVTVIFLGISFTTEAWGNTWLVWLIAPVAWQGISIFSSKKDDQEDSEWPDERMAG